MKPKASKHLLVALMAMVLIIAQYAGAQVPVVNSFSPSSGPQGTIVKIWGSYFQMSDGGAAGAARDSSGAGIENPSIPPSNYNAVTFGTYSSFPTFVSATYIEVPVPSIPLGSYQIKVYNQNGVGISPWNFAVTSPPPPPPPPPQPISKVAFLHGFGSEGAVWNQFAQNVYSEFNVPYPTAQSYNGLGAISTTASVDAATLVPNANTVVIGSSMGGLLAREIRRQEGSGSRVAGIISVGTPHKGAPVTVNGKSNFVNVSALWVEDLALGWSSLFYEWSDAISIGISYLSLVGDAVYNFLDPFDLNSAAAQDMNPGSAFLNTLNANPSSTFPTPHYTIYSQEDWNTHWRLADAHDNGVESGSYIQYANDLIAYYASYAATAYLDAEDYYQDYLNSGEYDYLDLYYYWLSVGDSFHWGAYALSRIHQQDFNYWIVGEALSAQNDYDRDPLNDAVVPKYSQAPSFVSASRHFQALHTNHEEETVRPEVYAQIRRALTQPDINLPVR